MTDSDAALAANLEFYRAFATRDVAAMDALWARRAPVACLHPGWAALKDRDDMIQHLTDTNAQLEAAIHAARVRGTRPGRPPAIASDALDPVLRSVQSCFDEWDERLHVTRDEISEATLVVRLTVTPDGFGTMPRIASTPDQHPVVAGDDQAPALSSLELCVSAAVVRVRYPPSTEELDVEVTAHWSDGSVRMSPKVVDHHPVTLRRIELP